MIAPHNIEAEQGLLGAILLDNRAFEPVADRLAPEHFYDALHGEIYATLMATIAAGKLASPVTLAPLFENAPPISETVSVKQYLGTLAVHAVARVSVPAYADVIRDLAARRRLIEIATELTEAAQDPRPERPASSLIEQAEGELFALAGEGARRSEIMLGAALKDVLDDANRAYATPNALCGLSTGLVDLDERLGGLQFSDMIVLAGRPSIGKTALATNIAYANAKTGNPVHFFSQEMSAQQLALRLLAEHADISSVAIRRGRFDEKKMGEMMVEGSRLAKLPLLIDETGGISIAQLAARARRVQRRMGTKLIVVDYLQLMSPSQRRASRVEDVTEITTGLKGLAKELHVPVIALSQLSRQVEHRADKRPQLSDLRESGSIEQDADVVLFVYRDEYYLERTRPDESDIEASLEWERKMRDATGKAEVIIAKQRHGATGIVHLAFDAAKTRFADAAHPGQNMGRAA